MPLAPAQCPDAVTLFTNRYLY